jgi:hypothetical protein
MKRGTLREKQIGHERFGWIWAGVFVVLLSGLTGCSTIRGKWSGDASLAAGKEFQETRIRLREAVITRDPSSFADASSADFSWRPGVPPEGETAFEYWDRNGGWLVLDRLLKSPFVRVGEDLIAPAEATAQGYKGPKLVLKKVGKEWLMTSFTLGVKGSK